MDKLAALNYFVTAAETLNFRETAVRLAISPSVVTRTIAELETHLGEQLFKRNTRSIVLTSFGESFLPKAVRLLEDSDQLFQTANDEEEMSGIVRITSLRITHHEQILFDLLTALKPYPNLFIDWRLDTAKLDNVQHRIDMGIRIGREPAPNFIIKPLAWSQHLFAASPELVAKLGAPKDLEDLRQRYPFSSLLNPETGKAWDLVLSGQETFVPRHVEFFTTDPYAEVQSALAGKTVVQSSDLACREHFKAGRLVQLLPEVPQEKWQLYLYRPYQTTTPKRVLKVFEILEGVLRKYIS
ncbi:LysR family transcriptional regulator [Actinobacillus capsulatus]|uniref:LysR family transcriptional regulator n=1 Tax=Actinobacillus capsulatus TaxID=717 RepID=UPI00035E8ED5|nr:LysR family transcriptional regulator [Actinobacillus capsulatus]